MASTIAWQIVDDAEYEDESFDTVTLTAQEVCVREEEGDNFTRYFFSDGSMLKLMINGEYDVVGRE